MQATQLGQKALFARGARLNCRGRSLSGVELQVALCVQDRCTKRVGVAIPLDFGSWLLSFDAKERFREGFREVGDISCCEASICCNQYK